MGVNLFTREGVWDMNIREKLDYDKDTGFLTWREKHGPYKDKNRWNKRYAGTRAGHVGSRGYRAICLKEGTYKAHRLAWLHVHGEWPDGDIDHINGIFDDNRIENLRSVDRFDSARNKPMQVNNKSGVMGVHWRNGSKKWVAAISQNAKIVYLGCFDKLEEAAKVRREAEIRLGYHPNHGRG